MPENSPDKMTTKEHFVRNYLLVSSLFVGLVQAFHGADADSYGLIALKMGEWILISGLINSLALKYLDSLSRQGKIKNLKSASLTATVAISMILSFL